MSGFEVVASQELWDRLRNYLLESDDERLGFMLARLSGRRLLAREVLLYSRDATRVHGHSSGLGLPTSSLLEVLNNAYRRGLTVIEAHSHPNATGTVSFSAVDEAGQQELATYLFEVDRSRSYGALVLGKNAMLGRVWPSRAVDCEPINRVVVLGPVRIPIESNGLPSTSRPASSAGEKAYDRQILALGDQGQRQLRDVRVALVGLGGLGSVLAQELAYLGIRDFVLVDSDVIEPSNLNRLVGATPDAVGRPKVDVIESMMRAIAPDLRAKALAENIASRTAQEACASADIILGCVDTHAGRQILNEIAIAYLIPLIDCGVGIVADSGRMTEAGGRVLVWIPGRPCLLCAHEFDPLLAAEELESPTEHAFREQLGYVSGAFIPEPSVVSLNATIASMAATELLALVTGFRPSVPYVAYDLIGQRAVPRSVKRSPECPACAFEGLGDMARLERYAKLDLPADLPRLS